MGKPKEDRSGWVAVEPEFAKGSSASSASPIKPATTAYQFYQRENSSSIKADLIASGRPSDLGNLTKAISSRWQGLDVVRRGRYEDMAREDAARFARESHMRDVEVLRRREAAQRERENLILETEDGARATRGGRRKEQRRKDRAERRKLKEERKRRAREEAARARRGSGEDDESDDDGGASSSSDDSEYSDGSGDGSSSGSEDSGGRGKKKKAARAPKPQNEAAMRRREAARAAKAEKEQYIEERQEDLRHDRAAQAKRRLDFLLKQSDIFSHFGSVKEDQGRLGRNRNQQQQDRSNSSGGKGGGNNGGVVISHRDRDAARSGGDGVMAADGRAIDVSVDEAELEEGDEHEATFLTSQPSTLGHGKMRPYQLEGLNWMIRLQENGVNGILADEMGLGKTLQSISVLVYMREFQNCKGPHLIVVPKSTLSNWMNEFGRWAPTLSVVKFHGTKDEREALATDVLQPGQRDEDRTWNVCVTTYEVCNLDRNVLNKFAWSYLIIDEAHRLKNEASAFSRTIRTFETRYRLLLTGTPLQNNLHELWALLNFLVPDVFASAEQFDEWFNLDIDDADEKNKLISQLHKILRPFMLRRLKVDVEKNLPPKHETILFTGMSAMQKKLYKDILMRDIDVLQGKSSGGGAGSRTAILNIVMQLRKCAGHPYLFPGVEDRTLPPLGEHLVQNCGKLVLLDKLLVRLKELGHRVLLFTQMTRVLDILEDYMVMRRFQYCRIDGNTSYDDREERIDAYNAPDSEKFLFLLSTRAGGLGINLQTADVVILYDSDWNPQADLQAQDRAHRIGQKKEVQVFRLVTEHTIEEKVVERAQQKLKLDAMVVQSGRLKEKDKLSREELIEAVRFGADKVFKSKDSTITEDDIDMILAVGKQKTQELNDKLKNAEKGDLLDFKLDGSGMSTQTFEGVDYSQRDLEAVKAAQAEAELLGILDMGKRERKTVANYNENQLYQQQIAALQGGQVKERNKKEIRLPKFLRLPKLEEWQMFDRNALNALQEEEEAAFRSLPEEQQKLATGKVVPKQESTEPSAETEPQAETPAPVANGEANQAPEKSKPEEAQPTTSKGKIDVKALPPLLSEEKLAEKKRLLAEGYVDWGRHHYTAFVKASAKFGRDDYAKIALEVGKPQSAIETYAKAFWDENFGKKRFSEHEYERVVKNIEKGEKKLEDVKGLQRGTEILISLFDNPWMELEFTHVSCKDKTFTIEEDRHLLCWAHKFGYGQWEAIKMAIRRSANFRFDYYLRSLPTEAIGRRCEQLMRAAQRDVEQMEKKAREEAGVSVEEEKKEERQGEGANAAIVETDAASNGPSRNQTAQLSPVKLPMFKEIQAMKRKQTEKDAAEERKQLEGKVEAIESQMEVIQKRLKELQHYSKEGVRAVVQSSEVPEELLPELANLVARSGNAGINTVANEFADRHPGQMTKKLICAKIEEIARKEKRAEEGDTKMVWYVLPDYMNLLDVETFRHLRKAKEERLKKEEDRKKSSSTKKKHDDDERDDQAGGAPGPDGEIVAFPDYDGIEPPRECKKAFTLFCNGTRREVKATLDKVSRKDKNKVNGILKDKWFSLTADEKVIWKKWQVWDERRYQHQIRAFERRKKQKTSKESPLKNAVIYDSQKEQKDIQDNGQKESSNMPSIPKKVKRPLESSTEGSTLSPSLFSSIPKKKRQN